MHYFFSIFGLGYCDIELLFYSTFRVYRLLVKILVKISSIYDAIQNKSLPKSEELERIFC